MALVFDAVHHRQAVVRWCWAVPRRAGFHCPQPRHVRADSENAIDRLLGDSGLRSRLEAAGAEIRRRDGLRVAADTIEWIAIM